MSGSRGSLEQVGRGDNRQRGGKNIWEKVPAEEVQVNYKKDYIGKLWIEPLGKERAGGLAAREGRTNKASSSPHNPEKGVT